MGIHELLDGKQKSPVKTAQVTVLVFDVFAYFRGGIVGTGIYVHDGRTWSDPMLTALDGQPLTHDAYDELKAFTRTPYLAVTPFNVQ